MLNKINSKRSLPLLLMSIMLFFISGIASARNVDLSNWTISLSGPDEVAGDTQILDQYPEIAVVGSTVHVMWIAGGSGGTGEYRVYYKRSTDGGVSFGQRVLVITMANFTGTSATQKYMAVDGNTVHIAVIHDSKVIYARSTDNGVSFESQKVLYDDKAAPDNDAGTVSSNVRIDASSGKVTIAWNKNRNIMLGPKDSSIVVLNSNDNGTNFSLVAVDFSPTSGGLGLEDLKRVGDNVYVLYSDSDWYYGLVYGNLFFAASSDGGATFKKQMISIPSKNERHKTYPLHEQHYVPKIAVSGSNVYVTWNGLDADDALSVFFRRSVDNGVTFDNAVNLTKNALPTGRKPRGGHETIAAKGNYVYVVFTGETAYGQGGDGKIHLQRSNDSGASFQGLQTISPGGGWWPVVQTDPSDSTGAKVHVFWTGPTYVRSNDGGATFTNPALISPQFSWRGLGAQRPQLAIGDDGAVHYVVEGNMTWYSTGVFGDSDIFYRRFTSPSAPSSKNKAISLVYKKNAGDGTGDERFDNMQVPASSDINFSSAITVEGWIKPNRPSGSSHYFVTKLKNDLYNISYTLGQWRTGNADARMNTDGNGWNCIVGGSPLPNDRWSHVAMTYDKKASGNNFKLYVNGHLVASSAATGKIKCEEAPLFVGGVYSDVPYGGLVDELRLWNRALSQSEIAANMYKSLVGSKSGLVAYYNFNDSTRDISGHGNDGFLMYKESYELGAPIKALDLIRPKIAGASLKPSSLKRGGWLKVFYKPQDNSSKVSVFLKVFKGKSLKKAFKLGTKKCGTKCTYRFKTVKKWPKGNYTIQIVAKDSSRNTSKPIVLKFRLK